MNPLLERFVQEARELLETAGSGLLALERDPGDTETINAVFRAVHTLKGSAGLFDIPPFIRLVHAGEDLFGAVREGRLALTSEHCDLLFQSFDHASAWIDALETAEALPEAAHEISRVLCERLRVLLAGAVVDVAAPAVVTPAPPPSVTLEAPAWLGRVAEAERLAAWRRATDGNRLLLIAEYRPDPQCFFSGEDPLQTLRLVPDLIGLDIALPAAWPPAEEFDPYACLLSFRFATLAPRGEIEQLFRYIPDQIQIAVMPPQVLAAPSGAPSGSPVYEDFVAGARMALEDGDLEGLGRGVRALLDVTNPALREGSVLRWLQALLEQPAPELGWIAGLVECMAGADLRHISRHPIRHPRESGDPAPVAASAAPAGHPVTDPTAHALLVAQRRMIALPCAEGEWEGRLAAAARTAAAVLTAVGRPDEAQAVRDALDEALRRTSAEPLFERLDALAGDGVVHPADLAKPTAETVRSVDFRAEDRTAPRLLKVDQHKVDLLMTLIGELVVAKNSLPFLARRAEAVFGSREMSREIKDQHAVIDRIAQEMQGAIMQVRMLPVSQLFQRFPRLVRDLSRKLGKQIDLVLEGEDTEADKDVIETLGDPLLHVVRNSLDHGVELPDDRLEAGKPATARIRMKAWQEADAVLIEIADDGRGVDPDKVRRKALEKGLIDAEKAAALSDDEAVQLVFLPGFSTAAEITDLSGRGVGMDVVRSAVHKAGGQVRLASRLGQGTVVTMRLPLSMAVTRVLVVESDNRLFGVPMDLVAETVRIGRDRIRRFKSHETFVLRERVVPLLRLRTLLGLPDHVSDPAGGDDEEEAVLVAKLGDATVGVVIDRFKERMDIILKPFSGVLAGISGYAGTALLGDGQVLPVLDLKALV
jgi:two-component system chemotaxis sensor kinase CheA